MPGNILKQIDLVVMEFRTAWKSGQRPSIEDFLHRLPEEAQGNLFHHLLDVEFKKRTRLLETPCSEEYLRRFPQLAKQVRNFFDESSMVGSGRLPDWSDEEDSSMAASKTVGSPPPKQRLGDYIILSELGQGGFGVVYEARHLKRNNRVALKTLPNTHEGQEINADHLHKFRKEFRALAEINHPNLVGMQTLEVDGDQWFFTMDLVEGEDFLSYVRPRDELNEKRLRRALTQLASGIIALHTLGIVHRDLKPSNVMVEQDGVVKILDFGLVAHLQTATDLTISKSGMFAGTPKYAAPEQMFGERSEASDWYAFGVILYESLVGRGPFTGLAMDLMRQKQSGDPPTIADDSSYPHDLAFLADNLVKKDPRDRLSTDKIIESLCLNLDPHSHFSAKGSLSTDSSAEEADLAPDRSVHEEVILIGREKQLGQLEIAKNELLNHRKPMVVWLSDKSGEGKSTLAEKFLRPIRVGREIVVLAGKCYDRESVPYKVIDGIIEPLVRFLRARSSDEVERMLPDGIDNLAHLFPLLRRFEGVRKRKTEELHRLNERQIRERAFTAFAKLLGAIGREYPIILFVDDLQWGDSDSAEVLVKLLNQPIPIPMLMIGSFRSDEFEASPFHKSWKTQLGDQLADRIETRQINVDPLSHDQCVQFVRNRFGIETELDVQQLADLYESSRGNPYFLEQLMEGYDAEAGDFKPVPVRQLINNRLARCPADAADLLDVISIAGKSVPLAEIAAVSGQSSTAISTLTHMRSERLVRLSGTGDDLIVDTYHEKIRETVLAQLPAVDRGKLHLRYAEALESLSASELMTADGNSRLKSRVFDLAFHFFEAKDGRGFEYSLRSAKSAVEAFAIDDAITHLKNAEQLQPNHIDRDSLLRLTMLRGRTLWAKKRFRASAAQYQQSLTLTDDNIQKSEIHSFLGEICWQMGKRSEAFEHFGAALNMVRETIPRTQFGRLLRICTDVAKIHPLRRVLRRRKVSLEKQNEIHRAIRIYSPYAVLANNLNPLEASRAMVRSCALAKHTCHQTEKAHACSMYAALLGWVGMGSWSRRIADKAAQLVPESQPNSPTTGFILYYQAVQLYTLGELDRSIETLNRSLEIFRESDCWMVGNALHLLRHIYSAMGQAGAILETGLLEWNLGKTYRERMKTGEGLFGIADGLCRCGRFDEAVKSGQESLEQLETTEFFWTSMPQQELGRAYLYRGDYHTAVPLLRKASRKYMGVRPYEIMAYSTPLYVEALLGPNWHDRERPVNRRDLRTAKFSCCASRLSSIFFPNIQARCLRMAGRIQTAFGRPRKAQRFFTRAIDTAQRFQVDYEVARSLIDRSLLESREAEGDRVRGIELLESLGSVLPDSEVKYLGLDRKRHHARAATARKIDVDQAIAQIWPD